MIKLENFEVVGWEHAIRGMRNPMNSWRHSDSEPGCEIVEGSHEFCRECDHAIDIHGNICCDHGYTPEFVVGSNDHDLMMRLAAGGPVHAKYRRMITVYVDITAPLYWWKEFDTYKVGTVANSCSTMHKIHAKEFTLEDFSYEHLTVLSKDMLKSILDVLNIYRNLFVDGGEVDDAFNGVEVEYEKSSKKAWNQMIQLLPTSYNQKRTVMLNYEVLHNIYTSRKNHKLDEWHAVCDWIEGLPYSEIITGGKEE